MSFYFVGCIFCSTITGCNGRCQRHLSPPPQFEIKPAPVGCICPPTSEQTCQRKDCGRKETK